MPLLNLNRKIDSYVNQRGTPRIKKGGWLKILIVFALFALLTYIPLRLAYKSAQGIRTSSKSLTAAFKQNDFDKVKKSVDSIHSSVNSLNGSLNLLFWVRIIPFASGYYLDVKHFTNALSYELEAADKILQIIEPSKIELGFTGQPTPSQDSIAQAVKVLNRTIPSLDQVEPQLKNAADEVKKVETGKYPEKFGKYQVRSLVETAKNFILASFQVVSSNKDALLVAPSALGEPSAKIYLLLFQNDKELRATGGFMTAYAFLKVDKGHLSATSSDDIYHLDEKLLDTCLHKVCPLTPPSPIVKYLPEPDGRLRSSWSMRDSNLSPDLPTSLADFERMYRLLNDAQNFDGIITIDTQVVEELIKITGPIDVFGTSYSAEGDSRCNCPNVVYELERYAQVIEKGEKDRKAVLGILMQQLLARALSSSSEKAPQLINTGALLANQKHIMLYMHDAPTQQALSRLGWTGQVLTPQSDYLHINDSNFAGGKSNLYVDEKISIDIGGNQHKLTIEYKNPQPFNTWLNGINRDYIRVFVPKGSKLISSKGSDETVSTQEDDKLNKTYFEAFIQIRPQNSRVLSFEYTTPYSASDKNYQLLIQKQPGAKDHHYTAKVNGKKQEFDLTADKNIIP